MVAAASNVEPQELREYAKRFAEMVLEEVRTLVASEEVKDWYTTDELAAALGKSPFTIREKWCNAGRIEAEKDGGKNAKWRIPGREYRRLVNGGQPKSPPSRN